VSIEEDLFREVLTDVASDMTEDEAVEWYKSLPEEVTMADEALLFHLIKVHPDLRERLIAECDPDGS